mmetsp:Transcript_20387/g.51793  ORF Transcript_20387/g.51793 Transcript_20387/m.51793 type:complete len:207 (-) Transcript_20387:1040-1660(-)
MRSAALRDPIRTCKGAMRARQGATQIHRSRQFPRRLARLRARLAREHGVFRHGQKPRPGRVEGARSWSRLGISVRRPRLDCKPRRLSRATRTLARWHVFAPSARPFRRACPKRASEPQGLSPPLRIGSCIRPTCSCARAHGNPAVGTGGGSQRARGHWRVRSRRAIGDCVGARHPLRRSPGRPGQGSQSASARHGACGERPRGRLI